MSELPFVADIHLHPTIKSFNSGRPNPKKNIWEDIRHRIGKTNPAKFVEANTPGIAKYSQSNLNKLAEGRVRMATASLYPMEKGFLNLRQVPRILMTKRASAEAIQVINGMTLENIFYLQEHQDYFQELTEEYEYIYKGQGPAPDGSYRYRVVNNFQELKETLQEDDRTLALILSVEGAHSLLNDKLLSGKLSPEEERREISEVIGQMKSWEVPPFSMNFSHHFYNGLCGHSRSFMGATSTLLNQNKGLEAGFTALGLRALKELLSQNNGKRVVIDTKHMSVKGRIEYYKWVKSYNFISKSDKIPIICSHTGVSGYKTMKSAFRVPDNAAKLNRNYFSRWNINISDEEIGIIHESTGIIGIMLGKTKLGGGLFFKQYTDGVTDEARLKEAHLRIFLDNVLRIVKVLGKPGWDIVALGSDYDGAIEHIDPYDTAATMPAFAADLQSFLERHQYERDLWHGYTPEEIVHKIMYANALAFHERHFV